MAEYVRLDMSSWMPQDLKKKPESSWYPRREISGSSAHVKGTKGGHRGSPKAHEGALWRTTGPREYTSANDGTISSQISPTPPLYFLLLPPNLQDKTQQLAMEGANKWWEQGDVVAQDWWKKEEKPNMAPSLLQTSILRLLSLRLEKRLWQ